MKYQTFNVIQAEKSWGYTKSDTYMYRQFWDRLPEKKSVKVHKTTWKDIVGSSQITVPWP